MFGPTRNIEEAMSINTEPEWSHEYLDYELLKRLLNEANQPHQEPEVLDPAARARAPLETALLPIGGEPGLEDSTCTLEDAAGGLSRLITGRPTCASPSKLKFRRALVDEILRVDSFYKTMVNQFESEFTLLDGQVESMKGLGPSHVEASEITGPSDNLQDIFQKNLPNTRNGKLVRESSKRAFSKLYCNLSVLEKFAVVNNTAVASIMKLHDVQLSLLGEDDEPLLRGLAGGCSLTSFVVRESLSNLQSRVEEAYASVFCGGSVELSRIELMMARSDFTRTPFDVSLRLGARIGICMLFLAWILWDVVVDFAYIQKSKQAEEFGSCHASGADLKLIASSNGVVSHWFEKDFPVYRGLFSIAFAFWCWGGLLYVWEARRINYLLMLEFDESLSATALETLWFAADFSILVFASFLCHFKVLRCQLPRWPARGSLGIWPLIPLFFPRL